MEWFCWTTGYENTPQRIKAETAEAAAEAYVAWYDEDRCDRRLAREGRLIPVWVAPSAPTPITVKCRTNYRYESQ